MVDAVGLCDVDLIWHSKRMSHDQAAEVVTDRREDGIDGIALAVPAHPMFAFETAIAERRRSSCLIIGVTRRF